MAYRFEYRSSFWQDYSAALAYIAGSLKNPIAAKELDEAFEREKQALLSFPTAGKPFASPPDVDAPYYTLRVKSYLAFYVVVGDVVEFRRFLYSRANLHDRLQ